MKNMSRWLGMVLIVSASCFLSAQAPVQRFAGTITLAVDATQAPGKLIHAEMIIPVTPGPLTLLYPKWIPGEHGPTGPIEGLTGLKIATAGQPLRWRRDDVDTFAIHVTVPDGARELKVALDYASPTEGKQVFTAGASATARLAVLSWNWVLLYPQGYSAEQISYRASLRLPAGWQADTSLPIASRAGDAIEFQPASLYTLVDSPVIAGQNLRPVQLSAPGATPPVVLDLASDSAAALQMAPQLEQKFRQLVSETVGLFGATHYRQYHFLYSLSDHVEHFGLEHHESNDSRSRERSLIDPQLGLLAAGLLPHEYVHSWNGKYRRPAGLNTPDYSQPMKGALLWVYEGLTEYLGDVLTARSGLRTPEQYRDALALTAASMEYRSGRSWRPLIDTAIDTQDLYGAPDAWQNWRRSVDFYPEGELVWLDADTTIRSITGGKKSLDDFCRLFFGPPGLEKNQPPAAKPYTFDDVVRALNQVAPHDWSKFWEERLWLISPHAPMGGIEAAGWKLVFDESPSEYFKAEESVLKSTDLTYSLGITLDDDAGRVADVVMGSPAAQAGVMPGMKLVAVNGRAWSPDIVHEALTANKDGKAPLQLLIENAEFYKNVSIDYRGGNRYPHLVSNGRPDLLTDIIKQHAETVK